MHKNSKKHFPQQFTLGSQFKLRNNEFKIPTHNSLRNATSIQLGLILSQIGRKPDLQRNSSSITRMISNIDEPKRLLRRFSPNRNTSSIIDLLKQYSVQPSRQKIVRDSSFEQLNKKTSHTGFVHKQKSISLSRQRESSQSIRVIVPEVVKQQKIEFHRTNPITGQNLKADRPQGINCRRLNTPMDEILYQHRDTQGRKVWEV